MKEVLTELLFDALPIVITVGGGLVIRSIEKSNMYKKHQTRIDQLVKDIRVERERRNK